MTASSTVAIGSVAETMQVIVFKLGEEFYGLPIDQIKEVVLTPQITKMPQTPPFIKGVANIRGNVIAILDLEIRFNLSQIASDFRHKYTLVIESEDYKMGLLVNEVPITVSIHNSALTESLSIMGDGNAENGYIKGIINQDEKLIILIDIFKVVENENYFIAKKG